MVIFLFIVKWRGVRAKFIKEGKKENEKQKRKY